MSKVLNDNLSTNDLYSVSGDDVLAYFSSPACADGQVVTKTFWNIRTMYAGNHNAYGDRKWKNIPADKFPDFHRNENGKWLFGTAPKTPAQLAEQAAKEAEMKVLEQQKADWIAAGAAYSERAKAAGVILGLGGVSAKRIGAAIKSCAEGTKTVEEAEARAHARIKARNEKQGNQ